MRLEARRHCGFAINLHVYWIFRLDTYGLRALKRYLRYLRVLSLLYSGQKSEGSYERHVRDRADI